MEKTVTFLHSGDMGDLIAGMCAVKEVCERDKAKAVIVIDTTGGFEANPEIISNVIRAQTKGRGLKLHNHGFDFLYPLLKCQPYVADVIKWTKDVKIDINLNAFRIHFANVDKQKKTNNNLVFLHQIAAGLEFGYKGPWLSVFVTDKKHGVVIARSTRFLCSHILYDGIENKVKPDGRFIGTEFEAEVFKDAFGWCPPVAPIHNALDAAKEIATSNTIVVNSTIFYWIAVGLGHPNIIHEFSPDVPCSYFPGQNPPIKYINGRKILK